MLIHLGKAACYQSAHKRSYPDYFQNLHCGLSFVTMPEKILNTIVLNTVNRTGAISVRWSYLSSGVMVMKNQVWLSQKRPAFKSPGGRPAGLANLQNR